MEQKTVVDYEYYCIVSSHTCGPTDAGLAALVRGQSQTTDLPAYPVCAVVVLRLCDKTGCVTTCETVKLS